MLFEEAKEILKKNGYRLVEDTDESIAQHLIETDDAGVPGHLENK